MPVIKFIKNKITVTKNQIKGDCVVMGKFKEKLQKLKGVMQKYKKQTAIISIAVLTVIVIAVTLIYQNGRYGPGQGSGNFAAGGPHKSQLPHYWTSSVPGYYRHFGES